MSRRPKRPTMRWEGEHVPIPYVTTWTSEKGWVIRHDPLIGQPAWFASEGGPGIGRPNVSKMQPERCRDVVVRCRCQVCGVVLGKRRSRYVIDVRHPRPDPKGRPVLQHPWCCRACIRDSYRWCPTLRERRPVVLRVRRHDVVLTNTFQPDLPEPPDGVWLAGTPTAIGYARIVVLDGSPVDMERL